MDVSKAQEEYIIKVQQQFSQFVEENCDDPFLFCTTIAHNMGGLAFFATEHSDNPQDIKAAVDHFFQAGYRNAEAFDAAGIGGQ